MQAQNHEALQTYIAIIEAARLREVELRQALQDTVALAKERAVPQGRDAVPQGRAAELEESTAKVWQRAAMPTSSAAADARQGSEGPTGGSLSEWSKLAVPPPLFVGTRVLHPTRGRGTVILIDHAEARGKPFRVRFDIGEEHSYSKASCAKFRLAKDTDAAGRPPDHHRPASEEMAVCNPSYSECRASSVRNRDPLGVNHGSGRLDSLQGWSAAIDEPGQWWQMDVGSEQRIGGVVTQGRTSNDEYVTSYKVEVSRDASSWTFADGGNIFTANAAASDDMSRNTFAAAVIARYVRIVVQSWNKRISMRAAVLLCGVSADEASPCRARECERPARPRLKGAATSTVPSGAASATTSPRRSVAAASERDQVSDRDKVTAVTLSLEEEAARRRFSPARQASAEKRQSRQSGRGGGSTIERLEYRVCGRIPIPLFHVDRPMIVAWDLAVMLISMFMLCQVPTY